MKRLIFVLVSFGLCLTAGCGNTQSAVPAPAGSHAVSAQAIPAPTPTPRNVLNLGECRKAYDTSKRDDAAGTEYEACLKTFQTDADQRAVAAGRLEIKGIRLGMAWEQELDDGWRIAHAPSPKIPTSVGNVPVQRVLFNFDETTGELTTAAFIFDYTTQLNDNDPIDILQRAIKQKFPDANCDAPEECVYTAKNGDHLELSHVIAEDMSSSIVLSIADKNAVAQIQAQANQKQAAANKDL